MRVLLITNSFAQTTNGPARFAQYALGLYGGPASGGVEVRVLTEDVPADFEENTNGPVYTMRLHIPVWGKPIGQWLRMGQYLRRAMEIRERYPFDVLVYINAFNGWLATRWERQGRLPFALAGMVNDDNNLNATIAQWAKSGFGSTGLKRLLFKPFERTACHAMPLIIANSDYMAAALTAGYRLPSRRVQRLYKSVDAVPYPYQPQRAFGTPIQLLFVKADFMRGGAAVLAGALRVLAGKHPQLRFTLTLAGPAERFNDQILKLFADVPNTGLVLPGPLPADEVRTLMQEADIFCVPALQEALGLANMEAALLGTPIVSTTAGGIPEVLAGGRAAWVATPGDAQALADALATCISNPTERAHRQALARDYVVDKFDKAAMLARFSQLVAMAHTSSQTKTPL